ncbi:MAG: hypothetical protein WDO13_16295 [Verrucomicrobiota bacterium]
MPDYESGLGTFDVNYCAKCRMGLTEPYPSEETAGHLYDEKVSGDFDVIQTTPVDRAKDWLARRLLRRHRAGAGCARARLLLRQRAVRGARARSVSRGAGGRGRLSGRAAADRGLAAAAAPGLLEIGAFRATPHAYDLIVLRHVLEHTHRPVGTRALSRLAADAARRALHRGCRTCSRAARASSATGGRATTCRATCFIIRRSRWGRSSAAAGLQGEIGRNDMPLMGNMLEILLGVRKSSPVVQGLGAVLHPVQLAIERAYGSSTCLNVKARRPAA